MAEKGQAKKCGFVENRDSDCYSNLGVPGYVWRIGNTRKFAFQLEIAVQGDDVGNVRPVRVTASGLQLYWKPANRGIDSVLAHSNDLALFRHPSLQTSETEKAALMQKGLCITALSISALVLLAFLFDILLGFAGMKALAPYKSFSLIGDLVFMACAGVIGFLSWKVFRSLP